MSYSWITFPLITTRLLLVTFVQSTKPKCHNLSPVSLTIAIDSSTRLSIDAPDQYPIQGRTELFSGRLVDGVYCNIVTHSASNHN